MAALVEARRLAALRSYDVVGTPPEGVFDDLTRLAAQLCDAPIALISLVDADRQWFKSHVGLEVCTTSRETSFCAHALASPDLLVVPDTRLDPRFATNPMVTGEPMVRFYAGAPLVNEDGHTLGTLCVLDTVPRELTDRQSEQLRALARQAMAQLTLRRREIERTESERRWRSLVDHSPVAIGIISADGEYRYVNSLALEVYGVSSAVEMTDRPAADFIAPGREDETRQVFLGVLSGESIHGWQWTLRQQSGTVIDVVLNAARVTYEGEPAVMLQVRDISEQVAANRALQESERSWRTLFGASPVGIGLSNEQGRFIAANPALCALYGRPERDVLGHSAAEFTHPDDLASHRNATELISSADDGIYRLEKRYIRPDGEIRWAWLTITHTPGPAGQTWTMAHVQDVTDNKATERAIADSEANLRAVTDVVRHIQAGSDPRQPIVDAALELAQASYSSLLEPTPDATMLAVTATTSPDLVGMSTPSAGESFTAEVFRTGEAMFVAEAREHPLGRAHGLLDRTGIRSLLAVPVLGGATVTGVLLVAWTEQITTLDDRRAGVVSLLADQAGVALRQAALVAKLESLALTDPLTGLPNRRSWDQHLAHLLAMARRDGRPVTVALADLDRFKAFNDSRGHQAGDELLALFAETTRGAMRTSDSMARWGGEEFAISLPHCGSGEAIAVLDRLRALTPMGETCSIGCATWDGAESAEQLLARADRALYAAKAAGRDRTCAAETLV